MQKCCLNCENSGITGGMDGFAREHKKDVKTLCYKYCTHQRNYVYDWQQCENFKPKINKSK